MRLDSIADSSAFFSGVLGHTDHEHSRPWIRIDEHVTPILAEIVGMFGSDVVVSTCHVIAHIHPF